MSLRADIAGREFLVAFPPDLSSEFLPLLISEQPELEAVVGARVRFVDSPPAEGPRWIVDLEPDRADNTLRWDTESLTLISRVRDAAGLAATLQLLHSLVTLNVSELGDATSDDLPTAIARIEQELARGFPGFAIRNLDWPEIRAGFPPAAEMSIEDLERLVAMLQDSHTAVRRNVPVHNTPYAIELGANGATFRRVPAWSDAAKAGVNAGWGLEIDDRQGWLARAGSPPHASALIAGRRAIALNGVTERAFVAIGPKGEERRWNETARPFDLDELIESHVVANDTVYVRLHNWIDGVGIEKRFDDIIAANRHRRRMVLDLRGNTGGNLLLAKRMRRRFLRERTLIGAIQFTRGDGTLADPVELWDETAAEGRWPGELVALTDPLTFSASEDFLHGLQGLPHVTIMGAPSGGGSGRPRTLPLIDGWSVTISTALTFDRNGHCIEGHGIPVDSVVDPFSEEWVHHLPGR